MNVFQKVWRRQVASRRARTIWWFRRGWAKLGCFTCGHDCYEEKGDACPACGAPIDRDAPWWRAGKYPIWWAIAVAALSGPLAFSWSIYDELSPRGMTYPIGAPREHETLRQLTLYAGLGLFFLASFLATRRGRWRRGQHAIRLIAVQLTWWVSCAATFAGLMWLALRDM